MAAEARPITEGWQANAASLVIGRLVVAVLSWSGTIIIARSLGNEGFGRFAFVFGLLGMMSVVTDLGLGRVALSGVLPGAQDPEEFAGAYIVLRTLLGLLGYVVAVGFVVVSGYASDIVRATLIGGIVVIVATASHAYELVFQAQLRLHVVAVATVFGRAAQLALTVALALSGASLLAFVVPAVVAEFVIAGFKIPPALRLQPVRYRIRPRLWGRLLAEAVPLALGGALVTLYTRLDPIMLASLDGFTAVGAHAVAFKFVDLTHVLVLGLMTPVLTVLVRSWPDEPDRFRETTEATATLLVLAGGALTVHFVLFARETIVLAFGHGYATATTATRLLLVGEICAAISILGLTIVTAIGRHRLFPLVALVGLALNAGTNLWAIPRWGVNGAAATTLVTEVTVLVAMYGLVRFNRPPGGFGLRFGHLLQVIPSVLVGLGVGVAIGSGAPWPVAAVGAAVGYGAAAWWVGLVPRRLHDATTPGTAAQDG